ncbi:DUF4817 domain-containing protein [Trichonephila clavipes]|nr:DUF4817 domain-containing protein [Trichonephila clavipes]
MKDAPSTASCCRIKGDDQGVEVTVRTSKVRLESSLRRSNKATLLQHQQGYLWISHSSKKNVEQTRRIVWSLWEELRSGEYGGYSICTPSPFARSYLTILPVSQVIYSQFGLAIHQNDHQARRRFVEWAQNEIAVVPDFHTRILFSDEAHFWLNGYVNKQNCRIWSEANPQVYVETPLHPEKLTV